MVAGRFSGETPWDAIINHFGLDIEDEANFESYCISQGYPDPKVLPLERLEVEYQRYKGNKGE